MIDFAFIGRFEGFSLVGYVPRDHAGAVEGNSGVTVATGVDLGSMNPARLDALSIPDDLKAVLRPYLGAKGEMAVRLVESIALTLTKDEAEALDAAVLAPFIAALRTLYNRYVLPGLRGWNDLSDRRQTVIASVGWQYGDLPERCPKFWLACVHQDWPAAVAELRSFGDRYPTRRNAEADLLASSP